ncbi:MAG: hypothetical protein M1815_003720 [Lichina confinis]|nr:MAG: hypothetical protein M1815_003720 [Lichina confinis]
MEEGEAANDTPVAAAIGDHRTSSDLTIYRDRRISTHGKPLTAKVIPAEAAQSRPYRPTSDHPDASRANRRRPFFRQGLHEISTKHETRLVALCGEYVCSTGHVTKIWDIRDGNLVMTLPHQEPVRITSVAFRSSRNPEDVGRWLWLGTNHGEIQEIDVLKQEVAYVKSSAHPRREVVTIHPRAEEMWTLDDEGKLHLWPPDETGSPSLRSGHYGFRVPKGHSFSLVVVDELWVATGKDIRVFRPSSDQGAHFDVLAKPLSQATAGDITSGAVLGPRSEEVYFGHTDGKVSIYARQGYRCLNIVSVSLYKISSLAGVGYHLWAGFNTGMVYVYDTRTDPWTVKKDWRGHESPVTDIVVDRTHVPRLDPLRVVSLGIDSFVRLWDGLLQEDWLESEMHSRHADYCTFRNISALVTTWNAGASVPNSLQRSGAEDTFFEELARHNDAPDVLVFGFQELVDLEDTKLTAKNLFRSSKRKETPNHEQISAQYRAWRDYLTRMVREYLPSESYYLLHTATMVGLFTCVFAKTCQSESVRDVQSADVKCGMAGLYGNKGALVVRFAVDDSSLCFVNCHLAAGQSHTTHRNNDVAVILESPELPPERDPARRIDLYVGGGDGTMILDHEICILNGDLNYRIDTMGRDTVINAIRANNLAKPLERDQLLLARRRNPGFRLRTFNEAPITFAPTYKYDVGTDTYDTSEKKRAPAWCDRLLYRGFDRIEQLHYRRHEVRVSDHRPVSGRFRIQVKKISPKQRAPFQWAAIFHKEDINFTNGHHDLVWYDSGEKTTKHKLPCKVTCSHCRSPIMDEGRNMILLFPSLLKFKGSGEDIKKFAPSCHMFYGQRMLDIPDGKPKWTGLNEKSDLIEDSPPGKVKELKRKREEDSKTKD